MDMSIHVHILVDVAMQERDYHDALVVRRFLETFNRIDNHLVEAELPRLDAYIATLDGYYEYLEQRNRKPLKNGTRIGRKKEYLFVSDEGQTYTGRSSETGVCRRNHNQQRFSAQRRILAEHGHQDRRHCRRASCRRRHSGDRPSDS